MENLVVVSPNMLARGAMVDTEIYPDERSFLAYKNEQRPNLFVRVKMLVDTGSNISALEKNLIERLQLPRYPDKVYVDGAGGISQLERYRCVLFMDIFQQKALPMDILEGRFDGLPYHGVIGRDVLRFCILHYDGPTNSFRLSAPGF